MDNDSKHTSEANQDLLKAHLLNILQWSSPLFDLNPIEHVISNSAEGRQAVAEDGCGQGLKNHFKGGSQKLVMSMGSRLQKVVGGQ